MTANEKQVGGTHYAAPIQHWDYVQTVLGGRYLEGCATKYVSRWRKKGGEQDLEKASHYIEKLIEEAGAGRSKPFPPRHLNEEVYRFCDGYDLVGKERDIIFWLSTWQSITFLHQALTFLHLLMKEATQ